MMSNNTEGWFGGDASSATVVDWRVVLESGGLALFLQWVLYIFAVFLQTEKFYDFGGSIGFLLAVWHSYPGSYSPFARHPATVSTQRQFLASLLVTVWTVRLGSFLLFRVLKVGEDARFAKVKYQPLRFFIFWTIQALWIFLTSLPVLLLNSSSSPSSSSLEFGSVPLIDFGGLFLWVFGFLLESIADYQKFMFKNVPQNREKFMSSGVFTWCRHPNYFGEMVLWVGVFLITSPSLPQQILILALCSPIFVILLITFVSGIPILERTAQRKYGKLPSYQEYKANTPLLIPFVGSRG